LRSLDGGQHMAGRDRAAPDVVQPAVVGLAHHRVDGDDTLVAGLGQRPADDGRGRLGHGQGVGEHNRGLDLAQLRYLRAAHELAEAVAHGHAGRDPVLVQVAAVG
jgi:hypothetical protein